MKSIKIKLTLLVCLIALLVSLALTVVNSFMLNKTAVEGMNTSVTETAKAYASDVGNQISKYKLDLKIIATNSAITPTATLAQLKTLSSDMIKAYGCYTDVSFANEKGVPYDNATLDLSQRDYFKAAISGQSYISSPLVNKKDNTTVLYVAAKVNNGTGYNGIAFASLGNDVFSQIIKDVSIGEKGYGFIIDSAGTIVAHKDNKLVESFTNYITLSKDKPEYKELAGFISEMLSKKSGTGEVTVDKSTKYVAYSPIANTSGWTMVIVADKDEMLATYKRGLTLSLAVAGVFLILSFLFAFFFANSIGKPISLVTKRLELLSQGDLNSAVPKIKSKDEIYRLSVSLENTLKNLSSYIKDIHYILSNISSGNLTVTTNQDYVGEFINIKKDMEGIIVSLNNTISNISTAAVQVSSGSEMISHSSMALSQGATEQASAVEELTASLEQISSQTTLNASNADKANQLATNARNNAESGNSRMHEMLKAMDAINASSGSINKIIKVIDDIAFQTNILALNAAVEAARAGQHGKGFAVVAEEVRTLASRSASAAKETSEMIEGSIKNVAVGIKIAGDTAEALKKIVAEVANAADLVGSIAIASKEQASGIEQINQGIIQVSQVVQNNAATSEESAAASSELSSQANQLREVVSIFKIKN